MKKSGVHILTLIILLSSSNLFAGGKGGFGLKGGMAISTIGVGDESIADQKNRFRYGGTAGFSFEKATEKSFAFDLEVLYDLRGTKTESTFGVLGRSELQTYFHYLSVPISLKFYIKDVFNFHFGGYGAYAMGGKLNFKIYNSVGVVVAENEDNLFDERLEDLEGDSFFKRFDAGVHFGVEFVSKKGIGVGGRLSKGLVDITNDDFDISFSGTPVLSGGENAHTTEISVYAIFRFGKKKSKS